jgi:crotonobetainyl-CoA:carnitine CoA-transferase CaiB-like acyl-CoA transferase
MMRLASVTKSILTVVMKTKTSAEWQVALENHDIPWAPAHSIEDLIEDPHLKAVEMFKTMEHPSEGKIRMMSPPITFSLTPSSVYRHPPKIGEHTGELSSQAVVILGSDTAL